MTVLAYKDAFSELSVLVNQMSKENREKISDKFLAYIEKNKNTDYTPKNISLYNKDSLKRETKIMLSIIYRNYFITKEEKEKKSKADAKVLNELYRYENIFKNNSVKKQKNIEECVAIANITKFDIIKNKIKEIVSRIFKRK